MELRTPYLSVPGDQNNLTSLQSRTVLYRKVLHSCLTGRPRVLLIDGVLMTPPNRQWGGAFTLRVKMARRLGIQNHRCESSFHVGYGLQSGLRILQFCQNGQPLAHESSHGIGHQEAKVGKQLTVLGRIDIINSSSDFRTRSR